jgi:hypothetical protein
MRVYSIVGLARFKNSQTNEFNYLVPATSSREAIDKVEDWLSRGDLEALEVAGLSISGILPDVRIR